MCVCVCVCGVCVRQAGRQYTSAEKQHIVCAVVFRLDTIHSHLGVVVAADVERSLSVDGMNPVGHFWMVLYDGDGGDRQGLAVCNTLAKQT